MTLQCRVMLWAVLGSTALPAYPNIYAFTDESGVTHFSNVPVDAKYKLLIEEPAAPTNAGEQLDPAVLANASTYEQFIEKAAMETRVERELLRAVIVVESGFNARAVSRAGARGLMQLMPDTAKKYGVRNSFDPGQNIDGGARYLRDLLVRYRDDMELALAAYNAGERAVERHGRRIPPFPETRRYVPRVLKIYRQLRALGEARR